MLVQHDSVVRGGRREGSHRPEGGGSGRGRICSRGRSPRGLFAWLVRERFAGRVGGRGKSLPVAAALGAGGRGLSLDFRYTFVHAGKCTIDREQA